MPRGVGKKRRRETQTTKNVGGERVFRGGKVRERETRGGRGKTKKNLKMSGV